MVLHTQNLFLYYKWFVVTIYLCLLFIMLLFSQDIYDDKVMITAASVLAKLNKLNSNLNGHQVKKGQLKVPYTIFYIPQLMDKIDMQIDYMRWVHSDPNMIFVSIYCIKCDLLIYCVVK